MLGKEGFVPVKIKDVPNVINLSVLHAKQNKIKGTEKDLAKACKPEDQSDKNGNSCTIS